MKKCIQTLLILAGLGTAATCWLDVTYWIDPISGFPQIGGIAIRYGAIALLYVLAAAASMLTAKKISVSAQKNHWAALASGLCGVTYTVVGALRLAKVFPTLQSIMQVGSSQANGEMRWYWEAFRSACASDTCMGVLALLCAWTLFAQSDFWRTAKAGETPVGGIYFAASGLLYLCGMAFERFLAHTSSMYRVYHIVQLLSVMVGVVFMLSLLRVCFFPETGRGRSCVRNGLTCFYICTCCELVFSIVQWKRGYITLGDLLNSLALGMTGLLGLVYSLHQIDPEQLAQRKNLDE